MDAGTICISEVCQGLEPTVAAQEPRQAHSGVPRRRWLYPEHYPWVLTLGALDVVLTSVILRLGGSEMNIIADRVFTHAGLAGMIALKLAALAVVVYACEHIGRHRLDLGRCVASLAIAGNTIPVTVGLLALTQFAAGLMGA